MLSIKFMRHLCNSRVFVQHSCIRNLQACKVINFGVKHLKPIENYKYLLHQTVISKRTYSSESTNHIDANKFEEVCEETLESLCDYFEELVENSSHLKGADVVYGGGVLTISFGDPYGTYVINRQTPNKQIWLSSPTSGPKRYDYDTRNNGCWVYKHDGVSLHQLLQTEIHKIVNDSVDFSKCSYSLV